MENALGIGHVNPVTLEVLKEGMFRLVEEGYRFIHLNQKVR